MLFIALATVTTYYLLFSGPSPRLHVVPYMHDKAGPHGTGKGLADVKPSDGEYFDEKPQTKSPWDIDIKEIKDWKDPDDHEDPNDVEPGYETDGKQREPGDISKLQHEKDMRKMWRYVYKMTKK